MRNSRKNLHEINIWPGFVDILGTLLIVTIFTVLISTVTQIFFNDQLEIKRGEISTLDEEIKKLLSQIEAVTNEKNNLNKKIKVLNESLESSEKEKASITAENSKIKALRAKSEYLLKMKVEELNELVNEKGQLLENLKSSNLETKNLKKANQESSLQIFELKRNLEKLNNRLTELSKLLIDAEEEDKRNKVQIKNLGKKLNQALANRVAELKKYQSDFFKKIKTSLGDRDDIIVSGDRFIFPSEIFFKSGSDIIEEDGLKKLSDIALNLKEISEKIPEKIDWILRVDGHTDKIPINNDKFSSNWHLSSSRSINIVKFFIEQGIAPHRLVAAGFGENYPIEKGDEEKILQKNRRIEIKLTTR